MSHNTKQQNELQGMLVSLLGIIVIVAATALIYFIIARLAPGETNTLDLQKDPLTKWLWLAFGTLFFIYGIVGALMERIEVGWRGNSIRVTTVLEGVSAFITGIGTMIGGLMMLITAAFYFVPSLTTIFHPFATLACGFVAVIISWILGPSIRTLGY